MIIYGLKNCDTCRKAIKAFPQATFCDVRAEGVPEDVLTAAFTQFGAALLNTRSTTWRGLDALARAEEPLALIKSHPTLMKRPLVAVEKSLFLGWSSDIAADIKVAL